MQHLHNSLIRFVKTSDLPRRDDLGINLGDADSGTALGGQQLPSADVAADFSPHRFLVVLADFDEQQPLLGTLAAGRSTASFSQQPLPAASLVVEQPSGFEVLRRDSFMPPSFCDGAVLDGQHPPRGDGAVVIFDVEQQPDSGTTGWSSFAMGAGLFYSV